MSILDYALKVLRSSPLALLTAAATLCVLAVGQPMQAAAQDVSPTEPSADRDTYYPNTEALAEDEMRVIACGDGYADDARLAGCRLFPC